MVDLDMESAAWIEYTAGTPGSGLYINGDLTFRQRNPLSWSGERDIYNVSPCRVHAFCCCRRALFQGQTISACCVMWQSSPLRSLREHVWCV